MRIVCISDTHMMHSDVCVPDGDVLIHAGDLTMDGASADIDDAFWWLSEQPHERIIFTPGNHDFDFQRVPSLRDSLHYSYPRVEVLIDEETIIDGLRVYASPWQPWFYNWAYNFRPGLAGEEEAKARWSMIPDDVSILVTHGPVYGILDRTQSGENVGCSVLKARIEELRQLRLHVCGHIHEASGSESIGDVLYVNACSCDAQYQPTHSPIVVDLGESGHFGRWLPS
jgi:predicted phosphodiesterase